MPEIKLRELREFKGLKQYEMARLLNISNNAYSQYETGKRQMSYETMYALADYFAVSIGYMLGKSEQEAFLLTEAEKDAIAKYRKLDERGRQIIDNILDLESSRFTHKKASEKKAI
jgi:transcriptional regulator with XRE-family HTH domain